MAVVNVADVEGGSLTAQAAGAECRHTALVSKLGQGVCLIHELRQWAGTEEFFDRRGHGADIYKALRSYDVKILQSHALADNTLHTGEADAELVLQQLADAADAAVAEMVYIVLLADAVCKAVEIVDGCKHVVNNDVLRDKYIYIFKDRFLESVAGVLLHKALEDDAADLFLYAELLRVDIDHALQGNHAVGEYLDGLSVNIEPDLNDAGSVDLLGHVARDDLACVGNDLAGRGVCNGHCQRKAVYSAAQSQLLVELIAADIGNVVAAAVKEQSVEQGLGAFDSGRIAGAQLAVDLHKALVTAGGGVLINGYGYALVIAEDLLQALVCGRADDGIGSAGKPCFGLCLIILAHCLEEPGNGKLSVFIYTDIEGVVRVGLVLKPCAVIRDDGRRVNARHAAVGGLIVVHTGAADDLGDDNTLGAVNYKCAAGGHERKIAHEDLLLLDLFGFEVAQTHAYLQRRRIRCIACLALFFRILGLFVHGIIHKAQLKIAGIVGHGVGISKYFAQTSLEKPLVALLLNLQKVGHVLDFFVPCKALSESFAVENVFWHSYTLLNRNRERPGELFILLTSVLYLRLVDGIL